MRAYGARGARGARLIVLPDFGAGLHSPLQLVSGVFDIRETVFPGAFTVLRLGNLLDFQPRKYLPELRGKETLGMGVGNLIINTPRPVSLEKPALQYSRLPIQLVIWE